MVTCRAAPGDHLSDRPPADPQGTRDPALSDDAALSSRLCSINKSRRERLRYWHRAGRYKATLWTHMKSYGAVVRRYGAVRGRLTEPYGAVWRRCSESHGMAVPYVTEPSSKIRTEPAEPLSGLTRGARSRCPASHGAIRSGRSRYTARLGVAERCTISSLIY